MADYSVTFARSARKELEKLPPSVARRVIERIEALAKTPRSPVLSDFRATRTFGEFESANIG
jgi:mRNA-degrading endonuclease RelE of RelBE toxin-antitoxin system